MQVFLAIYIALIMMMTICDFILVINCGFKENILISHKIFKNKFPEFNNFGIFTFYLFISILSPIFGIIRLYYFLATIKKKEKTDNETLD